jgi:hypothetical protein
MRTDRHRNPTAATTDVARAGGLIGGLDFENGDSFTTGDKIYYTAKLLGDPIDLTIKMIDKATFYTNTGHQRWSYIAIPKFIWDELKKAEKIAVIKWMYSREGGSEMGSLFERPIT